jgi:hypothetical protein
VDCYEDVLSVGVGNSQSINIKSSLGVRNASNGEESLSAEDRHLPAGRYFLSSSKVPLFGSRPGGGIPEDGKSNQRKDAEIETHVVMQANTQAEDFGQQAFCNRQEGSNWPKSKRTD